MSSSPQSESLQLPASPQSPASPASPTIELSRKKRAKVTREQRDSHHDWQPNKNTSLIASADLYNDHSCTDKCCHFFNKLPMLSPFGPFRCTWDILVMFMLIYTSLEVPFTLGFGIDLKLTGSYYQFGIIALIIDLCLLCDIVLNFRTAYFDKYDDLRLITNAKRIAIRYCKGWFLLDLLTSFPFEFILPENNGSKSSFAAYLKIFRIFRLFRIFKILRLLKMVKLFDGFVSNVIARELLMAIRLFKVLCFALLSAHMCACLWYYTGCQAHDTYDTSWIDDQDIISAQCGITGSGTDIEDDSTLFVRYSSSWYWSVVTLFTTGYGDIIATNPYEQWIASVVILIGTCLFGYFVGTITSLITEGDKVSSMIVNKLQDAQHFCQQKKLPRDMARAVLTHTRYHCNNNYVLGDESEVLSNLPSYLAMDVSLYISRKYLEHLDFLGNKYIDPYIRGLIALKMKSISCNKGYKLFVKGDVAEKLYIQRIGKSDHFIYDRKAKKKHRKPFKEKIKRGDVVGEYAFIDKIRDSTLICQTWCEFYVLDVSDIKEILELHYGSAWLKKYKAMQKFIRKEYSKPIRKRKKRHCLLTDNPLLPSFRQSGPGDEDEDDADGSILGSQEGAGQQGHCDWGNEAEIAEFRSLRDLEKMTNEVLNANANDLNNNNVSFGLNALSRNAVKITKLTNAYDKNRIFLKKKMRNPLMVTSDAMVATKSLLRGLTRQNSFFRDLEVTKEYTDAHNSNSDTSSSTDDEVKYDTYADTTRAEDVAEEKEQGGDEIVAEIMKEEHVAHAETLDVAKSIVVEMMGLHSSLHGNGGDDDDDGMENSDDVGFRSESISFESVEADAYEENEANVGGKKSKKKGGGVKKKKKRRTQKPH